MPYSAFATQGSTLKVSISSTFTTIPGVDGIDGPGGQKSEIEVTAISDTASKYVGGLPDFGEVSFTIHWDPSDTVHQYLLTSFNSANVVESWKIVCADAGSAEIAFSGFVKQFRWSLGKNESGKAQVVIRVTGAASVTP